MKILVIDDNPIHQKAAKEQLKNHDVKVVGSYEGGQACVGGRYKFDVVLVDLLLPASSQNLSPYVQHFVGEEMPIGIFLALLAAKNGVAKYVGVFSDQDHHKHPASAAIDAFNPGGENYPEPFRVGEAVFLLTNNRRWIKALRKADMSKVTAKEADLLDEDDLVDAKSWIDVLTYLTDFPACS